MDLLFNKKWHEIHDWLLEVMTGELFIMKVIHFCVPPAGGDKTKLKLLKEQILDILYTAHYILEVHDCIWIYQMRCFCLFKSFIGINRECYVIALGEMV